MIRFSHAGGSRSYEFFSSFGSFNNRITQCEPRTCFVVFQEQQLPLRGVVDEEFITKAMALVPDDEEYLIAGLEKVHYGKMSWLPNSSGENHSEMKDDLEAVKGNKVACGPFPPWLEDNPADGTLSPAAGSMTSPRADHTATLLLNGKVLITGGLGASGILDTAELYDPATGQFSATEDMGSVRAGQTATLLQNGKVLLTGGYDISADHDTAVLYDPDAGTLNPAGTMMSPRMNHTAILLSSGKVLIAGGEYYDGEWHDLSTAELYTPTSGTLYRIGGVIEVHPSIQAAYDSMGSETMQIQALAFTGGLLLDQDLTVTLEGGYDSDFTLNPRYTVISGSMTISDGTAMVERLLIE